MKKGIVMKIDGAFLTLLTPEGEFLRAKKQNMSIEIGEEIHFFPLEIEKPFKSMQIKNFLKVKPTWIIMAAVCIILGSFIPMYQNNKAYAYMSIDVNPSIELGVNKKMQVVELTGFNKEGKKVISAIEDWKKRDISKLTQTILLEMKKEGFLKKSKPVIISTVRTEQSEKEADKMLSENIKKIKETVKGLQLELTVHTNTEKEMEKAHEQGITTGNYQENKNKIHLSNQNSKEKTNGKTKDNTDYTIPPQPSDSFLPPGQIRKQVENSGVEINPPEQNKIKQGNEAPNAHVQLKKQDENNNEQNQVQAKKQDENNYKQNQWEAKKQSYKLDQSNRDNSSSKKEYRSSQNDKTLMEKNNFKQK